MDALRFFRFQARHDRRDRGAHLARGLHRRAGLRAVHAGRGGRRRSGSTLLARGREFGLQPYGAHAMQSLRIEKALPLYGDDITEELTPFHVGLDRWIRFDKRDFIGRDALLRVQERGHRRALGRPGARQRDRRPTRDDPVYGDRRRRCLPRAAPLSGPEAGEQVEALSSPGEAIGPHHRQRQGPHGRQDAGAGLRADDARLPGRRLRGAHRRPARAGHGRADAVLRPEGARLRAKVSDQPQRDVRDSASVAPSAPRAPRRRRETGR